MVVLCQNDGERERLGELIEEFWDSLDCGPERCVAETRREALRLESGAVECEDWQTAPECGEPLRALWDSCPEEGGLE